MAPNASDVSDRAARAPSDGPLASSKEPHEPYYLYIARRLREEILTGTYDVGDKLPSETNLCHQYGVSRMTARLAVTQLVDEGTAYRIQGTGAFVSRRTISRNPDSLVGFDEEMRARGLNPSSRVLHFETRLPTAEEQHSLGVVKDAAIYFVRRLRLLNGEAIGLQHLRIPASVLPDLAANDLNSQSYYGLLRSHGVDLSTARQRIEAVTDDAIAQHMDAPGGTTFLCIDRVSTDTDGTVVEHVTSWFRGDRYAYDMNLHA